MNPLLPATVGSGLFHFVVYDSPCDGGSIMSSTLFIFFLFYLIINGRDN